MFYNARNNVIKFFDDYSSMVAEAKHKATKGTGLKILTSKQRFQILPITLAQIKAGNNSKFIKRNQANYLFFVPIKRNY